MRICSDFCWLRFRECEALQHPHLHTRRVACEHRLRSQLYISPPQLCHTLDSTAGTLGSTGGSCRAALGSINFIAYFYNPSLCMHPPSHPTTSALTVHAAVKFCVSPCFMAGCSPRLSRSLYLLLDVPLNICVYLLALSFGFVSIVMHFIFLTLLLWPLVCSQKHNWEEAKVVVAVGKSPIGDLGPSGLAVSPSDPVGAPHCLANHSTQHNSVLTRCSRFLSAARVSKCCHSWTHKRKTHLIASSTARFPLIPQTTLYGNDWWHDQGRIAAVLLFGLWFIFRRCSREIRHTLK